MKTSSRQVDGVTIVDLSGSITLDEGSAVLRKTVKGLSNQGSRKILLNLGGVTGMDSTGIGELVSAYTSVRNAGRRTQAAQPDPRGARPAAHHQALHRL